MKLSLTTYPAYLLPAGAAILGVVYLAISGIYLYFAHPHEDAYILYNYVNNFLDVGKVVYFKAGEPAEGATDFLWFVVLTLFTMVTKDPAISAALANGLGVVLIYYSTYAVLRYRSVPQSWEIAFLFALFLVLPYVSYHSYAGFGTLFYGAFVFWVFSRYLRHDYRLFPMLLLLLGLIRPDGLIIAFGFFGLALLDRQYRHRPFLTQLAIALVIGAAYFTIRMQYFNSLLPLPLIVKSHGGSEVNGFKENIEMVQHYAPVFVLATFFFLLSYRKHDVRRLLTAGLPLLLHFTVFLFAHQSQNISFRFQFPLLIAVSFYLFLSAAVYTSSFTRPGLRWRYSLVIFLIIFVVGGKCYSRVLVRSNPHFTQGQHYDYYINTFAQELPAFVDDETVMVLTEAGRIPFWIDCHLYDLVGLNTRRTAGQPPSEAYLDSLNADLFFIHTNHTLNYDAQNFAQAVTPVSVPELINRMKDEYRPLLHACEESITYRNVALPNTKVAPIMVYRYLLENSEKYDLFFAKHRSHSPHLYAFRKGKYSPALLRKMREAYDENQYRGYLALKISRNIHHPNPSSP